MSMARYLIGDVFDALATIPDGTVDVAITSPPFLALRSYLPADDPLKHKEIGSEATPAAFLDVMLAVTAELRRVLADHGSIAVEFGDSYSGSGGAGGDYNENGWREGQETFRQGRGDGWPLPKSRALIPELYRVALAYGINPLTGQPSPAGRWRVRNVVTWCRPNPPVGALGDKWRPATSDVVVACTSAKRYWDDLATRTEHSIPPKQMSGTTRNDTYPGGGGDIGKGFGPGATRPMQGNPAGAPLLDWWNITPGGYRGAHYAVFPPELVVPLVKAMGPKFVCLDCGLALGSSYDQTHSAESVPGMQRRDRPNVGEVAARRPESQVLFDHLPEQTHSPHEIDNEGMGADIQGLHRGAESRASHGGPVGIRYAASSDGGRSHRSNVGVVGGRTPQERGQGRQPDRQLGTADQDPARQEAQVRPKPSSVSLVREPDPDTPECPACQGRMRRGHCLDPFAGTGTTLAVATGHGLTATGIDIDHRNAELARQRLGMFLDHTEELTPR